MSKKFKVYIVCPQGKGEGVYSLVTEKGECISQHYCSSRGFAKGDLHDNRHDRKLLWEKEYGDYDVLFIGSDDMTTKKLLELNHLNFSE